MQRQIKDGQRRRGKIKADHGARGRTTQGGMAVEVEPVFRLGSVVRERQNSKARTRLRKWADHRSVIVVFAVWLASVAWPLESRAQDFTTVCSFPPLRYPWFSDGGVEPNGPLLVADDTIYGTATGGGAFGYGMVFSVKTNGGSFAILHSFNYDDGAQPNGGLSISGNVLYGTCAGGGSGLNGTIFRLNTDGGSFTNLYAFSASGSSGTNLDGSSPNGGLLLDGQLLYGTTVGGGADGRGVLYKVKTDGTGFAPLHHFPRSFSGYFEPKGGLQLANDMLYGSDGDGLFKVNTNGLGFTNFFFFPYYFVYTGEPCYAYEFFPYGHAPNGFLLITGNTIYGTAYGGGGNTLRCDNVGPGTVFKVNTDGSGVEVLHAFDYSGGGSYPRCGLALSGGTLYGTTKGGGSNLNGTVFRVNTNGSAFSVMHSFSTTIQTTNNDGLATSTNWDGAGLLSSVTLAGNLVLGAASAGGTAGGGSLFALDIGGTNFTILHSFVAGESRSINDTGAWPNGDLVSAGNRLFGVAVIGGLGSGVVFGVNRDGAGFSALYRFSPQHPGNGTNDDGASPNSLVVSDELVYGTCLLGGHSSHGTLFRLRTNGTALAVLHQFSGGADGSFPVSIQLSGDKLYGTTSASLDNGTVFRLDTNGTAFSTLYSFAGSSDGRGPGALTVSDGKLFGTASGGGAADAGVIFRMNSDGSGFTNLHSFSGPDGSAPLGRLFLAGNYLYGTASSGGAYSLGCVFRLSIDGAGYEVLHSFDGEDGSNPFPGGGSFGYGGGVLYGPADINSLFAINTDGTGFRTLHVFDYATEGDTPVSVPLLFGNDLYGTLYGGGAGGGGSVFRLQLRPMLTLATVGANVTLTWPSNFAAFHLQSATNIGSAALWSDISTNEPVVGEKFTVTKPRLGTSQFYRLRN